MFHLGKGIGLEDNDTNMFGSRSNNQPDEPLGIGSRIFVTLVGMVFLGAGLLIGVAFLRDAAGGLQTWTWRKTPCQITASAIRQENQEGKPTGNFIFDVKYRYTYGGEPFSSDQYKRNPESSEEYGVIARLTERYKPGTSAVCYVNPSAPSQAVMVRYNLFMLLVILFPLPFVGVGAYVIYFSWFRKSAAKMAAQPISDRASPPRHLWLAVVFFSFFFLIGSAALYAFSLRPALKILSAKSWPAVPCVVISSEVKYHSGSHGGTYSVNTFYTYEINGREFKSNTYDFAGGSSSGYEGKQAVVARYPRGKETVCYVNPDDPTDAVLERGFVPIMWFGLLALLFVAIGAAGLFFIVFKPRRSAAAGGVAAIGGTFGVNPAAAVPSFPSGKVPQRLVLKPELSPWVKFFAALFVCAFWNGIVSVFVSQAVQSWRAGHPEWGLTIFMIPFVGIGLGLVGAVLYCFLALFDPRPHLNVTPGAVPLGGTLHVQWNLTGRVGLLQNLHLCLEGREETRGEAGKNSETATSVFARLDIASVTTPREIRSGEASVTVPSGLVPSFAGAHNKIIWTIHVHGQIAHWPDLDEKFPVTVLPSAPAARPTL